MSESTYSLFQRGRRHLRAGMAAQATVALEKAKRREPDKASIREALGIAYFRIRRWSEAEAEFRKVLELSPVNDYAHYALGRCLEKQGRDRRGEPALQARELAPAGLGPVPGAHPRARLARRACGRSCSASRARGSRPAARSAGPVRAARRRRAATGRSEAERLAGKIARLRIFPDDEGRFDRSRPRRRRRRARRLAVHAIADTAKGNRPSFAEAAPPEEAEPLYERFCAELRSLGVPVETGVFGAKMEVELVNDGPVTIVLDA